MKLLLLGGTRFLGRAIAVEALARGMEVTCLARGTSDPPDGVAFVRADRNDDDALSPVAMQHWDAVIDVSMQPGQVRRAVRDLSTDHVVLVSTSSVYANGDRLEQDEDAPILPALDGDTMTDMSTYGPAKVACEGGCPRVDDNLDDHQVRPDRWPGRHVRKERLLPVAVRPPDR